MRQAGATYEEIHRETKVSKMTLAKWFKGTAAGVAKPALSRAKLAELKRTLAALPLDQLDDVIAKTATVDTIAQLFAGVLAATPETAAVAVASLRQLTPGKTAAVFAKQLKAKAGAELERVDPIEAIQVQLSTLVVMLKAAASSGDTTKYASQSRLLPGILRELRRFMPPEPPPSNEDPDYIVAAAAAREKFHDLIKRVVAGELEEVGKDEDKEADDDGTDG